MIHALYPLVRDMVRLPRLTVLVLNGRTTPVWIYGGVSLLEPSIVCPFCRTRSFNPNDIRERYCGRCHRFQEAW